MGVADARGRRFDAATGVGFVVVALVAFLLPGAPPKADDPTSKIASYLADHRSDLLASAFLLGIAAILFVWFLGALRSYLRSGEGGEGRLSAASLAGGIVGIVFILGGAAVLNGVAFKLADAGGASPDVTRAFFDASAAVFAMAGFGFATFFAAASCSGARSGALPPWAYWSGSVIAVIQVLGAIALFAKSGFFASGGAMGFIGPLSAMAWVVAVSVLIMRRDGVPPVPRTEP